MALPIRFNNTVYQAGFFGTDDGGAPTNATHSFRIDDVYNFPVTVNGTVTGTTAPGNTVTITYTVPGRTAPTTQTLTVTPYDNPNMILFLGTNGVPGTEDGTTNRFVFSNVQMFGTGDPNRTTFADDGNSMLGAYSANPPCFASGTRILAVRDGVEAEIAVESLRVGDLAVTPSGARRPIIWIGQRKIECTRHPRANEVLPVRIAAHAFGENRPARDLVVSPGHAIAVDLLGEALIPASSLINGATIRQETVERVTYWHVELDEHDLLLSENLTTESYLDMGNRHFFEGGETLGLYALPDAPAVSAAHADFCRPFHVSGALVTFARERLVARAAQLGWALVEDPLADLHLVVDGRRLEPEMHDLTARFLVPADAETVWLASDAAVPAETGGAFDARRVGVCVGRLIVDDGFGARNVVAADDPRLTAGFHAVEAGPQRWTGGRGRLPAELWAECRGSFFLSIELTRPALPRWVSPERAEAAATLAA